MEVKITEANFKKEVIDSKEPVLVDFWAEWCGPCKMLSPVIAEIARENSSDLKVGKVNVDEEPELARQFNVMSIPMLVLFKNGRAEKTSIGYKPKEEVLEFIGKR
ncbi:thioredoxin [Treponema sp.]|uniref:thioredoxin n=1 Tax=Treponema sp. TaxID=166 RepID=UPI003F73435C